MIKDISFDINKLDFGGKACGLKWLYENHFKIPESYFIEVTSYSDCTFEYIKKLFSDVQKRFSSRTKIALRSSGLNEDGEKASHAGNYKTFLNIDSDDEIEFSKAYKKIVENSNFNNDKVCIIVQKMIDAEYSGIMFTSNPENFSKNEMKLSVTQGIGDKLCSGTTSDFIDLTINKNNPDFAINENVKEIFEKLVKIGIEIENKHTRPMDIEYAVEKKTGTIYILQCRPITTILLEKNEIKKVCINSIGDNERLQNLDKIQIRLEAEKNDIMISNAYIVNCNCVSDNFPFDMVKLERSKYCKGYNIVVITPRVIEGKIVRHFIGKKSDAMKCITCNRYNFRAFPDYDNIYEALSSIYDVVKNNTWLCTIIIQEIFDPKFTGIMKKNGSTTFIEIARGHFVAKGIVPMSTYALENNVIKSKKEAYQNKFYRILEGHQIEQLMDNQLVKINDDILFDICEQFNPIFNQRKCNLEFGLLEFESDLYPYLIDYTIDNSDETLQEKDIENGVISNGRIKGKIVKIENISIEQSLNAHCQNEISLENILEESIIFVAELPDIKLMEKLNENNIGFIFKTGSTLCHLAILLRERHIPAIFYEDVDNLKVGSVYELNTYEIEKIKEADFVK